MPASLYLHQKFVASMPETAGRIPTAIENAISLRVRARNNTAQPLRIEVFLTGDEREWKNRRFVEEVSDCLRHHCSF